MSRGKYQAAKSQIALEALSVSPETTFSTECPICNGGQSREKKLSVTRAHNGALYLCFRSSCGFRGFVAIGEAGSKDQAPAPKKREARPYTGPKVIGSASYNGARGRSLGLVHDGSGNLVFECRSFWGKLLGHVTRSPGKVIKIWREPGVEEIYACYQPPATPVSGSPKVPWVIVEDCISALCCVSHGFNSVALLGTNMPYPVRKEMEIGKMPLVFLDPDARGKGIRMAEELGGRAILADADPKDLSNLGDILRSYV